MYHSISFWPADSDTGYLDTVNGRTNKNVVLDFGKSIYRTTIECLPTTEYFYLHKLSLKGITPGGSGKKEAQYLKYLKKIYFRIKDPDTNVTVSSFEQSIPDRNFYGPMSIGHDQFLFGYDQKMILEIEIDQEAMNSFPFLDPLISFTLEYKEKLTPDKYLGHNTWASWRLIPTSRPFISPPSPRLTYQQVPYTSGIIDMSEFGISDVTFDNRSGSGEFTVMNDMLSGYDKSTDRIDDGNTFTKDMMPSGQAEMWDWDKTYSTILDAIHGKKMKVVLEDDPAYCYTGRVSVESLTSEEHWTKINFNMDLDPYKQERFGSTEEWLWDAIDFDAEIDLLGLNSIILKPDESFEYNFKTLRNRIYPTITITKPYGYDERSINVEVYITDKSSKTSPRIIPLLPGINKLNNIDVYDRPVSLNDLYFDGESDVTFKIVYHESTSGDPNIGVTIDFKREGL